MIVFIFVTIYIIMCFLFGSWLHDKPLFLAWFAGLISSMVITGTGYILYVILPDIPWPDVLLVLIIIILGAVCSFIGATIKRI